jgi:hypothetical protein
MSTVNAYREESMTQAGVLGDGSRSAWRGGNEANEEHGKDEVKGRRRSGRQPRGVGN